MKAANIIETAVSRVLLPVITVALLTGCGNDEQDQSALRDNALAVEVIEAREQDVQTRLHAVGRLVSKNAPVLASESSHSRCDCE